MTRILVLSAMLASCQSTEPCAGSAQRCHGQTIQTCFGDAWADSVTCPDGSACGEVPADDLGPAGIACFQEAP